MITGMGLENGGKRRSIPEVRVGGGGGFRILAGTKMPTRGGVSEGYCTNTLGTCERREEKEEGDTHD